jgi:type VII secretion protein EccE
VAVGVTHDRKPGRDDGVARRPPAGTAVRPGAGSRRRLGRHAGQVVAVQAALALVLAVAGQDPPVVAATWFAAALVVVAALVRIRRRWLFEWIAVALRYAARRHALPAADPAALLHLASPDARVVPAELDGDSAATVDDGSGLIAILEVGDPTGLIADAPLHLPSPARLLPSTGPEAPATCIQLLRTGTPAPAGHAGNGAPATSYRQLTEGRLLGHERALVAVRVQRAEGWREDELRRALSSIVRKVRRRLAPTPARVLGEDPLLRVLGETAHHDGLRSGRETWQAVHIGGLVQSSFRLNRWPDLRAETARQLVPRLLALPAVTTTVSLTAGPRLPGPGLDAVAVDLTVRLAAVNRGGLGAATRALRRLLDAESASCRRLDGEQRDGLTATLPLALGAAPAPVLATAETPGVAAAALDALRLPAGSSGLMIGANRHGAPVAVRLFRAEANRTVLVGGVRVAQLVVLRALALGARILVQTGRPGAWEPFVRGAAGPGDTLTVVPPGRPLRGAVGTPLHPLLVVVDVGAVAPGPQLGSAWQATLVVRDELAPADADALSRADLVLLQPLRPDEAATAATALGLGASAEWLTRIREDMVALVNRRALRWARLSPTPIELQLVGRPTRG